jgi:hypothetical protein
MARFAVSLFLVFTTAAGLAQGTVTFVNSGAFPTQADRLVYVYWFAGELPRPLVGTNFVAQLYYGSNASSLKPHSAAPSRFRVPTTGSPGTWSGGTRSLQGFAPGQVVTMQVKVWDSSAGPTFNTACNGLRIVSAIFTYAVPPQNSPAQLYLMDNFRAMSPSINGIPCPRIHELKRTGNNLAFYAGGPFERCVVERALDIEGAITWVPVYTNVPPFLFTDTLTGGDQQRFYRLVFPD